MAKGDRARELNEIAKRQGFGSYYEKRKAEARARGYSGLREQREARAAGRKLASDPGKAAQGRTRASSRRQVYETQAGTIVKTTSGGKGHRVIESQIRHAAPGDHVKFLVDVRQDDGSLRRVELFSHYGWDADSVADAIDEAGGLDDFVSDAIAGQYGGGLGAVVAIQAVIS